MNYTLPYLLTTHMEGWINTTSNRKRFLERKEEQPKKKKKIKHKDDDELADELWSGSQERDLELLERLSKCIKKITDPDSVIKESKEEEEEANEGEQIIDLHAESAEIQKIIKDCSKVKLPSKEEIQQRQEIRKKREKNIKFDEVVRVKKTRESLPAHQCEMCQKFYDALDSDLIDKASLIMNCSRHRYNYSPPPTPPGYWELDSFDGEDILPSSSPPSPDIILLD